jgi:hypothetical protein
VDEIHAQDIIRSLSNQVRFAGHTSRRWTVLQHSLLTEWIVRSLGAKPLDCLSALLHDATEAYVVDLPSPVKRHPLLGGYAKVEDGVGKVLARKYGFTYPMPEAVRLADAFALRVEADALVPRRPRSWGLPDLPGDMAAQGAAYLAGLEAKTPASLRGTFRRRWADLSADCQVPSPEPDEVTDAVG